MVSRPSPSPADPPGRPGRRVPPSDDVRASSLPRHSRRAFVVAGAAGSAWLLAATRGAPARGAATLPDFPFRLGVASGYPGPTSVVLWTRLAPEPFAADGGLPAVPIPVRFEVAEDARFRRVVARGTTRADPRLAHSVHVLVDGLRPGREYHYRFRAGAHGSRHGRTRTTAAPDRTPSSATLALVSCQRWEHGWFSAYRGIVAADPDLVLHVGDYVYENAVASTAGPRAATVPDAVRPRADDLTAFRLRHALYKTDPDLQDAHAAAPWAVVPDNHDAVEDADGRGQDAIARRRAAHQAYFEHLPLPPSALRRDGGLSLYRGLSLGRLADLHLLDTRQSRDSQEVGQAPPPNIGPPVPALADPGRRMLGARQERWLGNRLARSGARWGLVTQTVLMAHVDFDPGPAEAVYQSGWDGYPAQRERVLDGLAHGSAQPVVLGGDWHTTWINELRRGPAGTAGPTIATELLAPAVSSDPAFTDARSRPAIASNPVVRHYDSANGHLRLQVTPRTLEVAVVDIDADRPDGVDRASARWAIEAGDPVPRRA